MTTTDLPASSFDLLLRGWRPRRPVDAVCLALPAPAGPAGSGAHAVVTASGAIRLGVHWDLPAPLPAPGHDPDGGALFVLGLEGPDADAPQGDAPQGDGPQARAALWAASLVQDRFGLRVDAFTLAGAWRPGMRPVIENALRAQRGSSPPGRPTGDEEEGALAAARAWLEEDPSEMASIDAGANPETARAAGIDPATLARLRPHAVTLWGNRLSQQGPFPTSEGDVERIFAQDLPGRLARTPARQRLPIVIYAHGGLVDLAAGLRIAANQIPWWNRNGCYPLHFIWETGLFESIEKMLGVQRALDRGLGDVTDALVEATVRAVGGPHIWGNMKHSASSPFEPGAAGTRIVERLVAFARQHPDRVSLHAVGHSAGSIFHAHLLQRLDALDGPPLESLTLLAPAVTVDAYERLVDPLVPSRVKRIRIFTMRRDYERADTVTPAYRKSLLYLIHHALEPKPNEPILGLEECLGADERLRRRFGLAGNVSETGSVIWSVTAAAKGSQASRSTTHGGFDNDVPTMDSVARGILGIPDDAELAASFPPDTEERKVIAAPEPAAPQPQPQPQPEAKRPPAALPRPAPGIATGAGAPSRKALCVGINAYPAPYMLHGCVADSDSWAGALSELGFSVDKLQDSAATRANIVGRLEALIQQSRDGDRLVFQYAGHGTQVEDLDGDEPRIGNEPGQDQAICPVDFASGDLLIDDDMRAIFERLPAGVRLTCFMDNCNSDANTRFLAGRPPRPGRESIPRFVTLTDDVKARYKANRLAINGARALIGGRRGAGTRDEMRWVSFAACRSDESAWETSGRGDFSTIAVPLLAGRAGLTNADFQRLVTRGFGSSPRQTPRLDCRDGDRGEPFLPDLAGDATSAAGQAGPVIAPAPGPAIPPAPGRGVDVGSADRPEGPGRSAELAALFDSIARLLR